MLTSSAKRLLSISLKFPALPMDRFPLVSIGHDVLFSTIKKTPSVRPSLRDLNMPRVHFIDAKGSILTNVSSLQILDEYAEQKYDLLQVGSRDSLPIIKAFPKSMAKDPLQSNLGPRLSRQKPKMEKEKTIEMNSTIGGNDFEHKMHMLHSFLIKRIYVKVLLSLRGTSSVLDLENLFEKVKARVDTFHAGEIVMPIQQAAKKIQFAIRPTQDPESS